MSFLKSTRLHRVCLLQILALFLNQQSQLINTWFYIKGLIIYFFEEYKVAY